MVLSAFDLEAFLETSGIGRKTVELKAKQAFFSQGDAADSVYYLRKGRAKITIVSKEGKEATITTKAIRTKSTCSESDPARATKVRNDVVATAGAAQMNLYLC